jgi:hypothetical protein
MLARASFNYSIFMVWRVEDKGVEPLTLGLQSQCSPTELIPRGSRRTGGLLWASLHDRRGRRANADRSLKTK